LAGENFAATFALLQCSKPIAAEPDGIARVGRAAIAEWGVLIAGRAQVTVASLTGDFGAHAACARSTATNGAISSASATADRSSMRQFGTALLICRLSAESGWLAGVHPVQSIPQGASTLRYQTAREIRVLRNEETATRFHSISTDEAFRLHGTAGPVAAADNAITRQAVATRSNAAPGTRAIGGIFARWSSLGQCDRLKCLLPDNWSGNFAAALDLLQRNNWRVAEPDGIAQRSMRS
jgi:hypothetical protein